MDRAIAENLLSKAGFVVIRSKKHQIWSNGQVIFALPHHKFITKGVEIQLLKLVRSHYDNKS
jgi:hypothetical protein